MKWVKKNLTGLGIVKLLIYAFLPYSLLYL